MTLFFAVILVFGSSVMNGFVWDDHAIVQGRKVYREFDLHSIFLKPANDLEYLPIRDITYAIDFAIWGEKAAGFHATNLLLYMTTAAVLYFLTLKLLALFRKDGIQSSLQGASLLITLCYLLHPVQAQAVNLIMCRNVLLSGLFFFASCLCCLNMFSDDGRLKVMIYVASLFLFMCAMLSKGTAIILPIILLLFIFFDKSGKPVGRRVYSALPFFGISAVFYFIFKVIATSAHITGQYESARSIGETVSVALQIPWFYARKLLLPFDLAPEYNSSFSHATVLELTLPLLFILVVVSCVYLFRRKYTLASFGLFWFLIALIPALNIFATSPIVADRYVYLSAYGFILAVGGTILDAKSNRYIRSAFVLLIAVFAITSFSINSWWRSDKTLWETAVAKEPELVKGYTNLGWTYFYEGNYGSAFDIFKQEQRLAPTSINLELAAGYRLFLEKRYEEAIPLFKKSLFKKDDALYPLFLLARCYLGTDDTTRAAETLNRILLSTEIDFSGYRQQAKTKLAELHPRFASLYSALRTSSENYDTLWKQAELQMQWGFYQDALQTYKKIPSSRLDGIKFSLMAYANYALGEYDEAVQCAARSIESGGDSATATPLAGKALMKKGNPERAAALFQKEHDVSPDNPEALILLATAQYNSGNRRSALENFTAAQRQFSDYGFYIEPYLLHLKTD